MVAGRRGAASAGGPAADPQLWMIGWR